MRNRLLSLMFTVGYWTLYAATIAANADEVWREVRRG
jgi:hypothetical protein